MTIQTEVLIETLKDLRSDLRWYFWNIFSTQEYTVAVIVDDEYAAVFFCKGEIIEEYWDWILNALI